MRRTVFIFLLASASTSFLQADPVPTLTLIPASGNVYGPAGSTVGWGFTFSYTGSDYAFLTGSEFFSSPVPGQYTDYLSTSSTLYVAGPAPDSSSVTSLWDPSTQSGLGQYQFYSSDPPGMSASGDIVVHYSIANEDPNNADNNFQYIVPDATLTVAADATVTPEPSSLLMIFTASLAFALLWRRRRNTAQRITRVPSTQK